MAFRILSWFGRTEEKRTISLMKKMMLKIMEINKEFSAIAEAFRDKDYKRLSELSAKVGRLEHDSDRLRREASRLLCKGAFLPMTRENLHRLLYALDDVADEFEDAALFLVYTSKDKTPKEIREYIIEMIEKTMLSVRLLDKIVKNVFENKDTFELVQKVYNIEHEVDEIRNKAYDVLFLKKRIREPVVQQVTRQAIVAVANVTNKVEDACDEIATLNLTKMT